jgi:MFS family permease
VSSLCGHSAYWALIVARGILVLDMSGSSLLVGVTTFAAMAPRFVIPPLAGYLADRFDRRVVLRTAFVLNLFNNVLLTALAFAGVLEIWHIIALSVTNGSIRTFQMTASASLTPNLVPRTHLLNATALHGLTLQGSRLVGPGLMAPALIFFGPEAAFLTSTLFYVVGVLAVSRILTVSTGSIDQRRGIAASLLEALSYVWHDRRLRWIFLITAAHCSMTMSFESIFPVFARDILMGGSAQVSYLMMGVGAGGLVGVLLLAGMNNDLGRGVVLLGAGIVSGLSMIALALSATSETAILATMAMGASQAAFMIVVQAMVQLMAPDAMRGRISGLNQINIGGSMALVNLANGFFADTVGVVLVLTVLGVAFTVVVFISLIVATLRQVYGGTLDLRVGVT